MKSTTTNLSLDGGEAARLILALHLVEQDGSEDSGYLQHKLAEAKRRLADAV